jgi:hypothetical protein
MGWMGPRDALDAVENKSFALSGVEPQFLGRATQRQSLYSVVNIEVNRYRLCC